MKLKMTNHYNRCWDKGLKIYPVPIKEYYYQNKRQVAKCKIVIESGNKVNIGTAIYNQDESLYDKINELYVYYSNKIV
jgi:hypothetical protein